MSDHLKMYYGLILFSLLNNIIIEYALQVYWVLHFLNTEQQLQAKQILVCIPMDFNQQVQLFVDTFALEHVT